MEQRPTYRGGFALDITLYVAEVSMKATVKVANPNRGMYAAEIDGRGEYVIFELLDSSAPELGDIVAHPDFYSMGGETFTNLTQRCEIDVFVQNVCGPSLVKKQCFL
jgi:hypothetical protein